MNFPYIYKNNPEYIYATSNDDVGVRYVLGKPAKKNIICFGINPSTATPEKLDKTIQNVVKIAENNGYDGWIMLNVYPKRETQSALLQQICKDFAQTDYHKNNLKVISDILNCEKEPSVWCAWGNSIMNASELYGYLQDIYELLSKKNIKWLELKGMRTKSGHPRHPSRVRHSCKLAEFEDFAKYMEQILSSK